MKIFFNFAIIPLVLCLLHRGTEAAVVPESIKIKLYSTGELTYGSSYVFHNETENSYALYQRGPCGKLMWIEREYPESEIGVCQCITTPIGLRQLIFWQPTNRCYFAYDQGPCETNEWLNRNSHTNQWECQPNQCPVSKLEKDANIDMESLIELETDYNFVDKSDNATCLRNKLEIRSWHFNIEKTAVSRFLYHKETRRFFPKGERGPCPPLMEIGQPEYRRSLDNYGECICRNLGAGQRPIVYWQKTNRCYFAVVYGRDFLSNIIQMYDSRLASF